MKLYVYMMLSGSICTLLYIFFNRVMPRELPLKWRRILLRVNTALYIFPLPWFAAQMKEVLVSCLKRAGMVFWEGGRLRVMDTTSIWKNFIIVNDEGKLLYITGYQNCLPVVGAFLIIFVMLILGWLVLYLKICRKYKRTAVFQAEVPEEALEAFSQGKTLFCESSECRKAGRKNVRIGFSSLISTPLTVGMIRPVILLPEDMKNGILQEDSFGINTVDGGPENSMESIIRHELKHISGWDMLGRFFAFMSVAMEWFNPLVYYVLKEEIAVSEMLCDEAAVGNGTKKEKSDYIRCVIGTVQKEDSRGIMAASLTSSGSLLEERIKRIIGKSEKKHWKSGGAAVIMVVCFVLSSIPVFAYQLPGKYTVTVKSYGMDEGWENVDRIIFIAGEDIEEAYREFRHKELLFKADNGRICCIDGFEMGSNSQEEKLCTHDYKPGIVAQHIRTSYGGCTVATWEAEGCAGCGEVIATGKRLATAGGIVCRHDS